jgi:hypothetical protein
VVSVRFRAWSKVKTGFSVRVKDRVRFMGRSKAWVQVGIGLGLRVRWS